MILDVWKECKGKVNIRTINETAWRMVESQEKISTRKLVDSIEEQKVLDGIIEESKLDVSASQTAFHPFLYDQFSYPPLKYGSRFGKKTEPSLWYGSLSAETTMVEKAFYRFALIDASVGDFGMVSSLMTLFSVRLKITNGARLNESPFNKYKNQISSPTNYEVSQLLGARMRANDLDGFTFVSARDKNMGINVGLLKLSAFANKHPDAGSFQTWQCNTTKRNVEFTNSINDDVFVFPVDAFQIEGRLPFPAV